MAIKINDIPPTGLTFEFANKLDLFDRGTDSVDFQASVTIKPVGSERFIVTGRVKAVPQLECSRCLKPFSHPVDTRFDVELAPVQAADRAGERELNQAELDTEFYEGEEIELRDIIREQILVTLPMVPLHDESCKGLCPVCGVDLNEKACVCARNNPEFGKFSQLKDLLKKKE
jgi:uncharacterized protein